MRPVIGVILGMAFGLVQLVLLIYAVRSLSTQRLKIWPFAVQFFCPFFGLGLCALLQASQLLPRAVTISTVLIIGAVVYFVRYRLRETNRKED